LEVRTYGELRLRADRNGLTLVFIPSLAAILQHECRIKERDLTLEEIEKITEERVVMAVPATAAEQMRAQRGYVDLKPTECTHG
jgi:hypothetical protein